MVAGYLCVSQYLAKAQTLRGLGFRENQNAGAADPPGIVAQLVEQRAFNPMVVGSRPTDPTNFILV
jgi:hypothetical protein